jgi:hypothetical protein
MKMDTRILVSLGAFTLLCGIQLSAIWREWVTLPDKIAAGPPQSRLEALRRRPMTFIVRVLLVIAGNALVYSVLGHWWPL